MQNIPAIVTPEDISLAPVKITLELKPRGTIAKRLRPLWPRIVAAIEEGVTHAEIIAQLEEAGLSIGLMTFRSELYRYRKSLKDAE